jgi:hypothetical protein
MVIVATGLGQGWAGAYQICLDRGLGIAPDRDQPGLAALAVQQRGPVVEVEIVDGRADRLGDPRAGAVEELQQCLVP